MAARLSSGSRAPCQTISWPKPIATGSWLAPRPLTATATASGARWSRNFKCTSSSVTSCPRASPPGGRFSHTSGKDVMDQLLSHSPTSARARHPGTKSQSMQRPPLQISTIGWARSRLGRLLLRMQRRRLKPKKNKSIKKKLLGARAPGLELPERLISRIKHSSEVEGSVSSEADDDGVAQPL